MENLQRQQLLLGLVLTKTYRLPCIAMQCSVALHSLYLVERLLLGLQGRCGLIATRLYYIIFKMDTNSATLHGPGHALHAQRMREGERNYIV